MTGYVKQGGVWKPVTQPKVKTGGVWKDAQKAYIKQGGVWKEWFSAAPIVTTPSAVKNFRIGPTTPASGNITVQWDANDPSENVTEYWLYYANDYPNADAYTNPSGAGATWAGTAYGYVAPPAPLGGYGRYQINVGNVTQRTLNWSGYTGGISMWNTLRIVAKNSFGYGDPRSNLVFWYSTEAAGASYNIVPSIPPRLTGFVDPDYGSVVDSFTVDFETGIPNQATVNTVIAQWTSAGTRDFSRNSNWRSAFAKNLTGSQTVALSLKSNATLGAVVAPMVYLSGLSNSGFAVTGMVYCGIRDGLYGGPPTTPNWRRFLPLPAANTIFNHTLVAGYNSYEGGSYADMGYTRAGYGNAPVDVGSLTPNAMQNAAFLNYPIAILARSGQNNSTLVVPGAANQVGGPRMIGYGDEVNEYSRYTGFFTSADANGAFGYSPQQGAQAQPEFVTGQTYNLRMYF